MTQVGSRCPGFSNPQNAKFVVDLGQPEPSTRGGYNSSPHWPHSRHCFVVFLNFATTVRQVALIEPDLTLSSRREAPPGLAGKLGLHLVFGLIGLEHQWTGLECVDLGQT